MNDIFRSQFRLPVELADKLREAAEASGRSMNAEIVARLQDSFRMDESEQREFEALREAARRDRAEAGAAKLIQPFDPEQALQKYITHVEALLAKRDEDQRAWWKKEFGYDPEAPQVKREPNKGPARSSNARQKKPSDH